MRVDSQTSTKRTVATNSSHTVRVAVAIFFWIVAIGWCCSTYVQWTELRAKKTWLAVSATMVSVRCVQEKIGAGYQPRAELTYRYTVGVDTYTGSDRVSGCEDEAALSPLKLLSSYTRAFYDPSRPDVSVLSTDKSLNFELVFGVALVGIAIFASRLVFWSSPPDRAGVFT